MNLTSAQQLVDSPASAFAPSDAALVSRLRAGDTSAGEVLVKRYVEPLMRYLRRVSGSESAAEDLHQQTWLSVLEHLDRFDEKTLGTTSSAAPGSAFKSWLFRIATNKANDVWRSRGREKSASEGMRLIVETAAPDASTPMQGAQQVEKLWRAVEQLPEEQRQVLLLRYYSDMKFVEIADLLGCPLNTALGRMHKAMVKLKQLMTE